MFVAADDKFVGGLEATGVFGVEFVASFGRVGTAGVAGFGFGFGVGGTGVPGPAGGETGVSGAGLD